MFNFVTVTNRSRHE